MRKSLFYAMLCFIAFNTQLNAGIAKHIPEECNKSQNDWFKEAAHKGVSRHRRVCIGKVALSWYSRKTGKLKASLFYNNVKKDAIEVKEHTSGKKVSVSIPLKVRNEGRDTFIFFCNGSCKARAESFADQLRTKIEIYLNNSTATKNLF